MSLGSLALNSWNGSIDKNDERTQAMIVKLLKLERRPSQCHITFTAHYLLRLSERFDSNRDWFDLSNSN